MKSASGRKLRSKKQVNNQNKQEEMDNTTSSKRKNATLTTRKKRTRVLAVDSSWCVNNIESLSVMSFAREFKHKDQHYCHSRYNTIIENHIPQEEQPRLRDDFNNWKKTLHCIEFWKEQKRVDALLEADSNCSDVINKFLVKNSEEVLASAENFHKPAIKDTTTSSSATKETPTSEIPTSVTSETSTSGTVTTTTPSAFTIDSSNNELDLKHYMLGGSDITALFRQYQNRADKILRPIILETYVQELLALGDVLFLAKNQHSNIKTSFFSEELLDKLLDNQNQVLLNKIPDTCPDFTTEDYMTVLKVLNSIDQNIITPKQAKLELLTLAAGMDSLKGNVIEGIGDL